MYISDNTSIDTDITKNTTSENALITSDELKKIIKKDLMNLPSDLIPLLATAKICCNFSRYI